ncbi:MAG: hypothetical protein ABI779_21215 [Acidobacteriota bacterium]
MLNIAGPEYDFGSVVFVVLEECEHRRRGFEADGLDAHLRATAKAKLGKIKAAYDEFGGSPVYWKALETEVLETALPQYIEAAREMNALEHARYDIWRGGDPLARFAFAVGGLLLGYAMVFIPYVRMFEALFAISLATMGFFYPEIKRWTHDRRHTRVLNRLVAEAARYQQNARLHYMTTTDIRDSFTTDFGPREIADAPAQTGDDPSASRVNES